MVPQVAYLSIKRPKPLTNHWPSRVCSPACPAAIEATPIFSTAARAVSDCIWVRHFEAALLQVFAVIEHGTANE
jgi:hypothetical protein